MEKTWQDMKLAVESIWVAILGVTASIGQHWDTIVARLAAFTALCLLLHTAFRRFVKKQKPKDEDLM